MENIKILLSLIDFLKKFLPIERNKKFSINEKAEVISYMKIYQNLGGKFVRTQKGIEIDIIYELALKSISNEVVIVELEELCSDDIYKLRARDFISGAIIVRKDRNIEGCFKLDIPYPGYGEPGFQNKNKKSWNRKIPKQKQKRIK